MKNNLSILTKLLALLLIFVMMLTACDLEGMFGGNVQPSQATSQTGGSTTKPGTTKPSTTTSTTTSTTSTTTTTKPGSTTTNGNGGSTDVADEFDFSLIPTYSPEVAPNGYVVVNNNVPFFGDTFANVIPDCEEIYGELDELGRCTSAYAMLGKDLLPTEARGDISSVTPTGWKSVTYPETGNQSLYNRTHLIGWALAGENANKNNLITGTTYMNQTVMQIFENQVLSYVKGNDTHVMYRVTPIFEGNNLVASGVLMEARSYEDGGEDIMFCVYLYNVQPGIIINYATGDSERENPGEEVGSTDFDGTIYDFKNFEGTGKVNEYKDVRTSKDGWVATWARIDCSEWIGKDVPQMTLNGCKDKKGTLTSATISGGVSEIYLEYGLSYADKKISFTVEIIQNGVTVASKKVENSSATQSEGYELHWILENEIEGDFIIKITNNCPSGSTQNKDRLTIWNLGWK